MPPFVEPSGAPTDVRPIVEAALGPVEVFEPGPRLTTLGRWFTARDGRALVMAVGDGRALGEISTAVAYAVAWQQDRDLILFVPHEAVSATVARLAHLARPVEVWEFGVDGRLSRATVPSVDDVVHAAKERRLRWEKPHDLGERAPLVSELVRAADGHWALEPAHRGSYLSWHCRGRQVLKLMKQGGGVLVQAGVQYRKAPAHRPPFSDVLIAPATVVQRAGVEAAVAAAVQDRLTGDDATHVEHQLQAALGATGLAGLGMAAYEREYPAWRGDEASGFVDFLGLDPDGRLHVIETKIGSDPVLVFQAVDYATWVRAHAAEIRTGLGWPAGDDSEVLVDLVVAPKVSRRRREPAIGPYTAAQLEALAPEVRWRVHVVEDARAEEPRITSLAERTLPDAASGMMAAPIGRA